MARIISRQKIVQAGVNSSTLSCKNCQQNTAVNPNNIKNVMTVFDGDVPLGKHISLGRHKQNILINHKMVKK